MIHKEILQCTVQQNAMHIVQYIQTKIQKHVTSNNIHLDSIIVFVQNFSA